MAEEISMADKQYMGKILYTREHLDAKVCAKKVGVSEKTFGNWVEKFNWKALRRRLLLTKEEQLNGLYEQLEALNNAVKDSDLKHADTRQADILIKLTAAIKNLETDLNIADLVESGIRFTKYLQRFADMETVINVTDHWHSFIQNSIKR